MTTATVAELTERFHAPLVGTAIRRWGWMRGVDALVSTDDLEQIASLVLFGLVEDWPTLVAQGDYPAHPLEKTGVTWSLLVQRVRWELLDLAGRSGYIDGERRGHSLDARLDRFEETGVMSGDLRSAISVNEGGPSSWLLQSTLAAYVASQDVADQAALALRYFDDLPLQRVADLLGASLSAATNRISKARERLRSFALMQVCDDATAPPATRGAPWTPPEALSAHVRAEHGVGVAGWLDHFLTALRVDVSYLCDMLGPGHTFAASTTVAKSKIDDATLAEIERRHAAGETQTALAAEYGVSGATISRALHRRAG